MYIIINILGNKYHICYIVIVTVNKEGKFKEHGLNLMYLSFYNFYVFQ